ncbi:hypothetical protein PanWU01x14_336860, partial [Parasponia andersonii]
TIYQYSKRHYGKPLPSPILDSTVTCRTRKMGMRTWTSRIV